MPKTQSKSVRRRKTHKGSRKQTTKEDWYIGTSGFMTSREKWLKQPELNCIEINSTFYGLPGDRQINSWKQLPDHVYFSIKASRYITHMKRLKNVKSNWTLFWNRISPLGNKLKAVLLQLPPSFAFKEETFQRVKEMSKYLPKDKVDIVFEFRNRSWFRDEVYALFKKAGWCLGGTLIDKKSGDSWMGNMPAGLHLPPKTNNTSYLRIHGARGYRGSLSKQRLSTLKEKIRSLNCRANYVMFNNTFFEVRGRSCHYNGVKLTYAAVCNAVEFARI